MPIPQDSAQSLPQADMYLQEQPSTYNYMEGAPTNIGLDDQFNSNDSNILQRKLLALQNELSQLDTEHEYL